MGIFAGLVAAFSGPFGTILNKLLAGVFIGLVLFGGYLLIVRTAKLEQKAIDQGAILQQVVTDQKAFIDKTQEIIKAQEAATANLNSTIATIQENALRINTDLNSPEVVKTDRPSSDIIKNTLKDIIGTTEPKTKPIKKLRTFIEGDK